MLDQGATRSVISKRIVDVLNLPMESKNMRVITVDSLKDGPRDVASFSLSDLGGEFTFPVSNALVGDILTLESDVPPTAADIEGFSHLEGVTFDELPDKSIGVLLSVKYAWSWTGGEYRRGAPHELVAFLTCYGWTTMGCNRSSTSNVVSHCRLDGDDLEVKDDVKVSDGNEEDVSVNEYKYSSVDSELAYNNIGRSLGLFEGHSSVYVSNSYVF